MKKEQKFFICLHCGNLADLVDNKGVSLVCCGDKMAELVPNMVEASTEKHIPVATATPDGLEVVVGSVAHPMEEKHHIAFVYVETNCGGVRKFMKMDTEPKLTFRFANEKPVAVYAYCNLHGMWKAEL